MVSHECVEWRHDRARSALTGKPRSISTSEGGSDLRLTPQRQLLRIARVRRRRRSSTKLNARRQLHMPPHVDCPPSSRFPLATVAAALAATVVAFGTWGAIRPANDSGSDLPIYEEDASIILHGNVPYRDLPIEYPPGALPMFLLPAVMFGDARDAHGSPPTNAGRRYHLAFDSLVVLLTAAMVTCTALSLAALRRPPHVQAISLAVVASAPLLVGHVFVERFDIWPAALTAAAL